MSDTYVKITLGDETFPLKETHDFTWLQDLGSIIQVFAHQDSGNISFGVEAPDGVRKFIKYAGARTAAYDGEPDEAVQRLKQAVHLYDELHHPCLVRLLNHYSVGNGYAAEFEWFEGVNLHPHETFPPPAKYVHPDSPYYRFKQLPVVQRLQAIQNIFDFHVHVEQRNYVAVDFYDGSILYDFTREEVRVCDIDVYQRKPYYNTMSRLWGSSRFMSPEEFEMNAPIDSKTNVFNMGAIAFGLLGGELDRSPENWDAGEELHQIALKAVHPNREDRYDDIAEFVSCWRETASQESRNYL
ncbi:serine/threonine protein kinase [Paenibacillus dakarensis]|uniref:serine/threonine protein kinase n=1 Tax=Paenibacillus dakarensis TaxID=1527293 RepID=UPI0006D539A2|nr:serine/threonine protein kinase [Paenibacillus dakarensis]